MPNTFLTKCPWCMNEKIKLNEQGGEKVGNEPKYPLVTFIQVVEKVCTHFLFFLVGRYNILHN